MRSKDGRYSGLIESKRRVIDRDTQPDLTWKIVFWYVVVILSLVAIATYVFE